MADNTPELQFRWLGRTTYQDTLHLQDQLVADRKRGDIPDTILLLEHEPVYTIGRSRDRTSLRNIASLPHPVVETNRGGQATFHGPGQLVGYPILDLTLHGKDLHLYLRSLEDCLITFLRSIQIQAIRRGGLTGAWVEQKKIASIGVGVRQWVSMHGFALNVCADLSGFAPIIPCGIQDVRMTSINRELGTDTSVRATAETIRPFLAETFAPPLP